MSNEDFKKLLIKNGKKVNKSMEQIKNSSEKFNKKFKEIILAI
ncbi:MAG: hypothetical protein ABIH64_03885 [Nanoarchaeota archaeon]